MNCKEYRNQINNSFKRAGSELSRELETHLTSCAQCAAYLNDLKLMHGALNKSRLEVRPGELDDITFEKIVSVASGRAEKRRTNRIVWSFKWLVAPAVVAAAAVLIFMLARPAQKADNSYADAVPYSSQEIENTVLLSDSLGMEFLASLASDDSDLDRAADVLLQNTDIDDIINSLSADELKTLYEKIDNLKG